MHWVCVFRLMFEFIIYMDLIIKTYIYTHKRTRACISIQRAVTQNETSISASTEIFRSPSQIETAFSTKLTLLLNTTPKTSLYGLHIS